MRRGSAISRSHTTRSVTCSAPRAIWRRHWPSYQAALAIRDRLAEADPANAERQRDTSVSHNKIGEVQVAMGDLSAALTSYQASLAIADRLAKADPRNAIWQRDLAVSHIKLGDMQRTGGNLAAALTNYAAGHQIFERLAKSDPSNATWQRDLSVSHNKIGDVQRARGDPTAMLASYLAAHEIFERLAKADPTNALWQRDLSVSHNKLGDAQHEKGDHSAALSNYQASLAIRDRLAAADPRNASWQRDLSVSHEKIGDVQRAQGDLAAALPSYQAALAIRDRLAKADPGERRTSTRHVGLIRQDRRSAGRDGQPVRGADQLPGPRSRSPTVWPRLDPRNAIWQRDLAVSHIKLGDMQRTGGNLAAALTNYAAGHQIFERLAKADPSNATGGSAISPFRITRSATCNARAAIRRRCWRATWPRTRSSSVWRKRTRRTPYGSATSLSRTTSWATRSTRRATTRRR